MTLEMGACKVQLEDQTLSSAAILQPLLMEGLCIP